MGQAWGTPSPFIFDGPVPPENLVGRADEINAIRAWSRAGRFMSLSAPRRFGKTSLIQAVARQVEQHDATAAVVADLYDVASVADLVIRLERAWATHTPARLRSTTARILAGSEVGLNLAGTGFTIALAERPQTDPLPALHALLDLPAKLLGHRGHARVLLVLDEFQSVSRLPGVEALIRSHAQHQRDSASYLFAGSEPSLLAAAFRDRARPLYGQAETFHLGRLPASELSEAIAAEFERSEKHVGDTLPHLVAASEGHPQRAMLLAHTLWSAVAPGQVAGPDEWSVAVQDAMRRVDAEARALLGGLRPGSRKTLRAVAEYGSPLNSRALRTLDLRKTTAADATQSLVGDGLIEQVDGRWRLIDPLLARWIRQELATRTPT